MRKARGGCAVAASRAAGHGGGLAQPPARDHLRCGRLDHAGARLHRARPATRRRPASTASCRARPSTSPISTTTPPCRSCSASPGRASPCMPAPCPGYPASHGCVRMPLGLCRAAVRCDPARHARRRDARRHRPGRFLPSIAFQAGASAGTAGGRAWSRSTPIRGPSRPSGVCGRRPQPRLQRRKPPPKRLEEREASRPRRSTRRRRGPTRRCAWLRPPKFRAEFQLREAERRLEVGHRAGSDRGCARSKGQCADEDCRSAVAARSRAGGSPTDPGCCGTAARGGRGRGEGQARRRRAGQGSHAQDGADLRFHQPRRPSACMCARRVSRCSKAPVTIADPDRPLGTYVFTALAYTKDEIGSALERRVAVRRVAASHRRDSNIGGGRARSGGLQQRYGRSQGRRWTASPSPRTHSSASRTSCLPVPR